MYLYLAKSSCPRVDRDFMDAVPDTTSADCDLLSEKKRDERLGVLFIVIFNDLNAVSVICSRVAETSRPCM